MVLSVRFGCFSAEIPVWLQVYSTASSEYDEFLKVKLLNEPYAFLVTHLSFVIYALFVEVYKLSFDFILFG